MRVKFVLPPDKKALHWHPLGMPVFKRDDIDARKHYCEGAFEVGVPQTLRKIKSGQQKSASWWFSSGYFYMWWTDPPNFTVVSAKAWINWYWDRSGTENHVIGGGGGWDESHLWTGWELGYHWNGEMTTDSTYGWTGAAYYRNQLFPPCTPVTPMYLYFDPVQVVGDTGGYLSGYGSTSAQGPGLCYLLLTPHSEVVRIVN